MVYVLITAIQSRHHTCVYSRGSSKVCVGATAPPHSIAASCLTGWGTNRRGRRRHRGTARAPITRGTGAFLFLLVTVTAPRPRIIPYKIAISTKQKKQINILVMKFIYEQMGSDHHIAYMVLQQHGAMRCSFIFHTNIN